MFIEFADVVEHGGNLPNQQFGILRERKSLVVALVVGFIKIGSTKTREKIHDFSVNGVNRIHGFIRGSLLVKPRFLDRDSTIVRGQPLSGVRLHNNSHTVVWNLSCLQMNSITSVFTLQLFRKEKQK